MPFDRIVLGQIGEDRHSGEPIVLRRRADGSVQLHCHGGLAAVRRIETALLRQGCRPLGWRDWAQRRHDDPIQAAARSALADAPTQRTAAILLDQYHGALRHALDEIQAALHSGDAETAGRAIDALLARARLGQHLVRAWRVVLTGRPNVGKSTLLNAILGYRRAIVHHAPGTTRDVLTADTAIDGWPVELSDTAGLWRSEHPIDRAGVERAEAQAAEADLVVLVFDLAQPWSEPDRELLERWPSALVVHNKCDLAAEATGRPEGLMTSALTGQGIEALLDAIADRLVPRPPPPGAAVPFTSEQIEGLRLAAAALADGDRTEAMPRPEM
ncbi:MAG: 50S ribosome-binding GTPase [Planctomycetia bacterium]|nr:50S ribosome-binding GTPase [Planctomycetia bacterium]